MADSDRIADYRVKIGFGGDIGNRFLIGKSTIGGINVFTDQWSEFFTGPYDDVTDDIAESTVVTITRGQNQLLSALQSGKVEFTVADPKGQVGFYDSNNASSPLFTQAPGFVPMRPVIVEASLDGWVTTEGLIYAFIRDAAYDTDPGSPSYATCRIQAEDLFLWMQRAPNPVISTVSGITSSQAVGMLLDSFGWTDPAFRSLSSSPALTSITFGADGTQSVLQLLQGILDAEQGHAYVDGNGVFHFEDRYARDRRRTASYAFSAELSSVNSRASADAIESVVQVTPSSGTMQTATDTTSNQQYGSSGNTSISTSYITTDADALDLADLILQRLKDPHAPQNCAIVNESLALTTVQLALELQQRVTISGVDCFVEQLTHTIGGGGKSHRTDLLVSEAPAHTAFLMDNSTFADNTALVGDYLGA